MHTQCCCGRRSCPWLYWKTLKANELAKLRVPAWCRRSPSHRHLGPSRRGSGLACQQRHTQICWGMLLTTVPSETLAIALTAQQLRALSVCILC